MNRPKLSKPHAGAGCKFAKGAEYGFLLTKPLLNLAVKCKKTVFYWISGCPKNALFI
jgi:hypothetical protein